MCKGEDKTEEPEEFPYVLTQRSTAGFYSSHIMYVTLTYETSSNFWICALSRKTDSEDLVLWKTCIGMLSGAWCTSVISCDPDGQAVGSVVRCNECRSIKDKEIEEKPDPFCGIKRKKSQ